MVLLLLITFFIFTAACMVEFANRNCYTLRQARIALKATIIQLIAMCAILGIGVPLMLESTPLLIAGVVFGGTSLVIGFFDLFRYMNAVERLGGSSVL